LKSKAVITTKWDKKTYRPFTVDKVESFFVDTALDSDSDPFQLQIGDPDHALIETLKRDNEVRVEIFGVGYGAKKMFTGLADQIVFDEQGVLTMDGRDMSCLAVDSTVPPQLWKQIKASTIIPKQARDLGMLGPFHITTQGVVNKLQFTDASESYWDFWYRLVRKDQMYIWTGPDGSLWTGILNYNKPTLYFFGDPPAGASASLAGKYIPIETMEFRKSTQGRLAEVWVYGHRGDNGIGPVIARDLDIKDWIRKSRKIMMDTDAHDNNAAAKTGREEIYESKVGAIELRITIPDPGYVIQQNNMAHVNLRAMGLEGDYFVVGTRIQADSRGFTQEVRLREKNYAVTRRVPEDPKIADQPGNAQTTAVGAALGVTWGDFFAKAAKQWHGGWDYALYLATLLAICDQETGFANVRQNGGPGGSHVSWYPWSGVATAPGDATSEHSGPGGSVDKFGRTKAEWQTVFANEDGDGIVNMEYGVGPMQLTSRSYKYQADDMMGAGKRDEFGGGRWHPEFNIMVAAHVLRTKLQETTRDSFRDIDMWTGVAAYNGSGAAADAYAISVKNKVFNNPGYLQQVKDAQAEAKAAASSPSQPTSAPADPSDPAFGPLGKGFPYADRIMSYPGQGTHSFSDPPNNWQSDNALDISAAFGTPVYAVHSGHVGNYGVLPGTGHPIVQSPGESGDRFAGNRINIIGANQSSYYAHLSRMNPLVTQYGLYVKAGTLLGWSGIANGVKHLHFAVERGSPLQYIPGGDPR
jgi:prophage tail gpP-like protein/murein DD-endopeptidase MepM/ murein hydrolase activator NlpD